MDEFLALAYHQERGLDCVIARLFNTVGPRQSGQYGMVIPRFVERALAGEPLEIHGDGTQTRCFCHVADTVRALSSLMDSAATTRRDLQRRLAAIDHASSTSPSACSSMTALELGARATSRTTRSTATASRTCSTGSPAIEKIARRRRLAGEPTSTSSSPT